MDAVEIRRGTAVGVLTPSTPEDFAYVNAHLRAMDRYEQVHFIRCGDIPGPDSLAQMERAWTLRLRGEIVGYVALQVPPMKSPMASFRFVPMLSTTNVGHHPLDYVRLSRPILEYVVSQAPAWVTDFLSAPLERYAQSVKWHEKTMGWRRLASYDVYGERSILFHLNRKDIEHASR